MEELKERFAKVNLKVTSQRLIILDYILKTKEHPSAEMVYNAVRKILPTITLSTVYNTLESLANKGLIFKLSTPSGTTRYDGNLEPHIHFYDEKNNDIIDIYDDELYNMVADYVKEKHYDNFKINNIFIELRGQKS